MTAPRCTCPDAIAHPDPLCPAHSLPWRSLGEMDEAAAQARAIEHAVTTGLCLLACLALALLVLA